MQLLIKDLVNRLHALINDEEKESWSAEPDLPFFTDEVWADMASKEYRLRRLRAKVFSKSELFGEPAWDIVLDVFIRQMLGEKTGVTSACLASCVPVTTALRWIKVLEKEGLMEREDDPSDGRRYFLRMSPGGVRQMKQFLSQSRRTLQARKL